ncbi:MAG: aspartate kinase [Chloroflexota bacterium]
MGVVVQKYGGTSVGDAARIRNVAARVAKRHAQGDAIAVVVSAMGHTTDELIAIAAQISPRPDPREMDVLLSTGELISCSLLAMALHELGVPALSMGATLAGIRTDEAFGRASITQIDATRVRAALEAGQVVVVAGFQGFTPDGQITTLGRGGSDTTAVALAAALEAERCEVYTDVDGIYTADPRLVPTARKMVELGYEEMLELASYGAKMHPRSIELGAWYRVPILVASSMHEVPGTLIHDIDDEAAARQTGGGMEISNKVRGVTYQRGVARITVRAVPDQPGVAARLFEPLTEAGISVDTIVQNASAEHLTDVSFTVNQTDAPRALEISQGIASAIGAADCTADEHLGSVSIVGTGMQNAPGYASRMFRALSEAKVNIEMITTSQIRITCIVGADQVADAVRALHATFDLDED